MNLKDLLKTKDNPPELYWALVIEEGLIQSGIWYIGEGKAEVVGIGAAVPWESEAELIDAADAALSSAIQKLPEDYPEPQKTVFGVATSWVKDGEIAPENLSKIKKLCMELSLTPVGFVVLPEAIAHFYKSDEGAPLNAIVLKSGDQDLELSIFTSGKLAGTTEVARSVSLVDDVIEGLARFKEVTTLPTRFIVYDGKEGELEETKQNLIQANWGEGKVTFLHTPQVEVFASDKKILATALAGGAEIGDVAAVAHNQENDEEKEPEDNEEEEKPPQKEKAVSAESMGFTVGGDVSSTATSQPIGAVEIKSPSQTPAAQTHQPLHNKPIFSGQKAASYISKSKALFHSFSEKIFSKPAADAPRKNRNLILVLAILGLAIIAVGVLWWFVQAAKITVYVVPSRSEENVEITFDTGSTSNTQEGILPAKLVDDQESGEKTKPSTGTKLIGDKATGSVQVANGNSAAINLSVGTILTSSSGFKFVTNTEASISGQLLPGSPGTANIDVTAYDIGSQYNLIKGEVFSVGNYSKALVAATSTGDFTGGSSQQISAISKDDQAGLEEDLKVELTDNAKSNLSARVTDTDIFVDDFAAVDITSENFDHNIGDQADNLKLSLSLTATGLYADKEKILEYAKSVLSDKAPNGYSLSDDQIDFKFKFIDNQDGRYTYDVLVGGNFLPVVDTNKIKNLILGKTINVAREYLNSIPGFDHADVALKIKFPSFLMTIPRMPNNIAIEVKPE